MNGPPGSTIAQCPQDRRSTRRRLSRYSPRGQCSGDLESSSPSTKRGQLQINLPATMGARVLFLDNIATLNSNVQAILNSEGDIRTITNPQCHPDVTPLCP